MSIVSWFAKDTQIATIFEEPVAAIAQPLIFLFYVTDKKTSPVYYTVTLQP